jgi:hypothetical protein
MVKLFNTLSQDMSSYLLNPSVPTSSKFYYYKSLYQKQGDYVIIYCKVYCNQWGGVALVKEYVCLKSGYFISPERKDNIHLDSFS